MPKSSKRKKSDGSWSAVANKLVTQIRNLRKAIPGFTVIEGEQKYTNRYTIDPKYIQAGVRTHGQSERLQKASDFFDPDAVLDAIRKDSAFATLEKEAQLLAAGIHGMRVTEYATAVDDCDHLMAVARGITHRTNHRAKGDGTELEVLKANLSTMAEARRDRRKTSDRRSYKKKEANGSNGAPAKPQVAKTTRKETTTVEESSETAS